ncbi:UNVERIFIED_CONTAM: hypothetical protein FKN15_051883 [Acipenser sinensis]
MTSFRSTLVGFSFIQFLYKYGGFKDGEHTAGDCNPIRLPALRTTPPQQTCSTSRNNVDLNRVPQVIQQAKCITSHHCVIRNEDQEALIHSLESIPVSIRIPVLRKNQLSEYNLELETMQVACICATSRNSDPKKLSDLMNRMA